MNSNYLVHYFESLKWYKQVSDIAGEGARNHELLNIAVDDLLNKVKNKCGIICINMVLLFVI